MTIITHQKKHFTEVGSFLNPDFAIPEISFFRSIYGQTVLI